MEYLLIDPHQRFLGTFNYEKSLAVGDVIQGRDNQTFAVIGTNWSSKSNLNVKSVTVVRLAQQSKRNAT